MSHLIFHRTSKDEVNRGVPIITRGEGVHVFDQDGRAYLDLVSGVTRPVHVGYGREEIARVIYDQARTLHYFSPMHFGNEPAMELAGILADITPSPINRFFLVCDGSEAVESAIKLAKHYHAFTGERQRYKIISRRGAYHGVTRGALQALGTALPMRWIMEPLSGGAVFVESPYCYRCPVHLEYPGCDLACARDVRRTIEFEGPEQISAFIGEPVQQGFGALAPPVEYWEIIREICDSFGILLIVDEVICGFGRTGRWFGIDHFDIQPDMITMAKGLTSGYVPLGGVGCTDHVADPIEIFNHLHTYGNHPVACAAAIKNIDLLKEEDLIHRSETMGRYFLDGLKSLEKHSTVGQVRGLGLWTAIDFTMDKKTRALFPEDRLAGLVRRARAKGLIVKSMGWALEFAPPFIIQKEDIEKAIELLDQCITEEEREMGL